MVEFTNAVGEPDYEAWAFFVVFLLCVWIFLLYKLGEMFGVPLYVTIPLMLTTLIGAFAYWVRKSNREIEEEEEREAKMAQEALAAKAASDGDGSKQSTAAKVPAESKKKK